MHLHDATRTLRLGAPLAKARGVVILLHGRGSSADDIAGLSKVFGDAPLAYLAPEAAHNTWYPHRFLVPPAQNEPWLSSALSVINTLVVEALEAGIPAERIGLIGFSQGACLALDYAARHPRRYGFVAALSGALIGPANAGRDVVDLQRTPVLIACAEADVHIPLEHVHHSATTLAASNADVTKLIFSGGAHTVFPAELEWLKKAASVS
jgi:phospholipase/carboxylesterase